MILAPLPTVKVTTVHGWMVDVHLRLERTDGDITVWGALLVVEHASDILNAYYGELPDDTIVELHICELPPIPTKGT